MNRRDDNLAMRALISAVESNTESIRAVGAKIDDLARRVFEGFEMIDTKLDATMGALTDHIASAHGDGEP